MKGIFVNEANETTVITVPEHLLLIAELTNVIAENGIDDDGEDYDNTIFSKSYDYLTRETTKLYCKKKKLDPSPYHCEFLQLTDEDVKRNYSIRVSILYFEEFV